MNFADLHCVLFLMDEFRRQSLEAAQEYHNAEHQLVGVQEVDADAGLSSSLFVKLLARLESSISFQLGEGSLHWSVQLQMSSEFAIIRGHVVANYYEEPYQTIVQEIALHQLSDGENMCEVLRSVVFLTLTDLKNILSQNSLTTIHREGLNAPFFPNL